MGLFGKKKKEERDYGMESSLPELPKLPELPELPGEDLDNSDKPIHQLPSFPSNDLGKKLSQDTIKEAVSGRKDGEEVFDADDFDEFEEDKEQMMQRPLNSPRTRELRGRGIDSRRHRETEPVFIRLDKFEESLQLFEKAKHQIWEIEKMLHNIKKIKEQEDQELETWQHEMQKVKGQIEKVDQDIFSRIE